MKNIILILSLLLIGFSSCKESFLDQDLQLDLEERDIYTNPERIEATLSGIYAGFKAGHFMGGKTYVAFDVRGNDIVNITTNNVLLAKTYEMAVLQAEQETINTWYYAYLAINRANLFIDALEEYECEELLGSALYNQYIAEAKFIRSLTYYYLCQLYSQPYSLNPSAKAVPLRLKGNKSTGNNDCPRSTIGDIYAHILTDVSDANINALPKTGEDVSYASQAAAHMLKMRVLMAMGNWPEAIKAGEAISGYALVDNVAATFQTPYFTEESIFSLPMSTSSYPNTQQGAVEYYSTGEVCLIDYENGVMAKDAYSLEEDKRVKAFTSTENDKLLKFTETTKLQWIPIFRYAETLLNLAECYANNSQEDRAQECLELVRRRSIAEEDDTINVSSLTGEALLTAIEDEKRLEMIGEGISSIELIRKGKEYSKSAGIKVTSSNYTWSIPNTETTVNNQIND